jgi:predicted ATPase
VWLAELAPLTDPALVPRTVASVFGIREQPGRALDETLIDWLVSKQLLLVMDNCEHLVHVCATLSERLLRACASLKILATSRAPLNIAGETTWQLSPLSVPELDSQGSFALEGVSRAEATQLFVKRAQSALPSFTLTESNAPAVGRLCRRLDGIPLALELAAARMREMSVEQLAARLDDALQLLVSNSPTASTRQRTLRGTLEWSERLLEPGERLLFERLSVFAGGWTLDAAEHVCSDDGIESAAVLDLLGHLVDKSLVVNQSLVQVEQVPDGYAQYRFLDTIREFASERLRATDELSAVCRRHADHFLKSSEELEPNLWGPNAEVCIKGFEQDYDNARGALEWLIASEASEDALTMGAALGRFWLLSGRYAEGQQWMRRLLILRSAKTPTLVRAKLLRAQASLFAFQGDNAAAQPLAEEALAITRQYGPAIEIARSLLVLANTVQTRGDLPEARRLLEEAVTVSRRAGDAVELVDALHYLGGDAFAAGDLARARAVTDECLASAREARYARGVARAEWVLASIAYIEQDLHAARLHLEASIDSSRELNAWWEIVQASVWRCHVAAEEGDLARCASLLAQIRTLGQQLGDSEVSCLFLEGTAHAAAVSDHPELALRLAAAAEAYRETIGAALFPLLKDLMHEWLAPAREKIDPERARSVWASGRSASVPKALIEASDWVAMAANRDGLDVARSAARHIVDN